MHVYEVLRAEYLASINISIGKKLDTRTNELCMCIPASSLGFAATHTIIML